MWTNCRRCTGVTHHSAGAARGPEPEQWLQNFPPSKALTDLSKGVSNNAVVEFADQATNSELSSKRSTVHQLYSNLFSLWLWPPVARSVNRKEAQTPTHRPRPRRAASRVPRKEQLARLYRKIARRAPRTMRHCRYVSVGDAYFIC
jgi:hypothetical protein